MLQNYFKEKAPVTKIAREFGVSHKTFYKFKRRFGEEGVVGLKDKSRIPCRRPRKIPQAVEEAIVGIRVLNPDFGPLHLQAEHVRLGIKPSSRLKKRYCHLRKTTISYDR